MTPSPLPSLRPRCKKPLWRARLVVYKARARAPAAMMPARRSTQLDSVWYWLVAVCLALASCGALLALFVGPYLEAKHACDAKRADQLPVAATLSCRDAHERPLLERSGVCIEADRWRDTSCAWRAFFETLHSLRPCHNYSCSPSALTVFKLAVCALLFGSACSFLGLGRALVGAHIRSTSLPIVASGSASPFVMGYGQYVGAKMHNGGGAMYTSGGGGNAHDDGAMYTSRGGGGGNAHDDGDAMYTLGDSGRVKFD